MKVFFITIILGMVSSSFAQTMRAGSTPTLRSQIPSILCQGTSPSKDGITCCVDDIKCNWAKKQISNEGHDLIQKWLHQLHQETFSMGPNCFLFALAYKNPTFEWPWLMFSPHTFYNAAADNYVEWSETTDYQPGDILTISFVGSHMDREMDENGRIHTRWLPMDTTNHAMIYLGNGLVLQKENFASAVISISTLENAISVYEWFFKQEQHRPVRVKTQIKILRQK